MKYFIHEPYIGSILTINLVISAVNERDMGMHMPHQNNIFFNVSKFIFDASPESFSPVARACCGCCFYSLYACRRAEVLPAQNKPARAPIMQWVVLKGIPSLEPIHTHVAVANWALNPFSKSRMTMSFPTVCITILPNTRRPRAIPQDPMKKLAQSGQPATFMTTMSGLIALATSLDPWARQTKNALVTISHLYSSEVTIAY